MVLDPNKLRKHVLRMIYERGSGHIGGSFSIAELVAHLYSRYDLTSPVEDSSKLILSKGHAVPIIYAALHELGLLQEDVFALFREIDSPFQGHPDDRHGFRLKQTLEIPGCGP